MHNSLKKIFYILTVWVLFTGCQNNDKLKNKSSQAEIFPTWLSQKSFITEKFNYPEAAYSLPEKIFPWGGTVSHHHLTDKLIDDWFFQISKYRSVENFIIICPSHYGLSTQNYSIANGSWDCGELGNVETNFKIADSVRKKLNVEFDSGIYFIEHGASCLMPYMKKYFPKAKVLVIAVTGEPPVDMNYVQTLSEALSSLFTDEQKKKNFLLISTDFAHHGTEEQTEAKDKKSMLFFENPKLENFIACGCDNRPGMYALASLLKPESKAYVLYHTNSYEISGMDENDITSYFFSLVE